MRALIADDDPEFLDLIAGALEQVCGDVVCAASGSELLEELADGAPFDVVITDVSMPGMTGLEAMHAARTAGLPCPVVIMTALRDRRTMAQTIALGGRVALLYKPFSIGALRIALGACLGSTMCAAYPLS
jgi:two-component system capsular synthesis sensor histidine kinase RcsC